MNITESKTYTFTFNVEGVGFTFNVIASSQAEAMDKLYRALSSIGSELKAELSVPLSRN